MQRTTAAATLGILALAASLSACDAAPARFDGTPVTEDRAVTEFDSIEVRGVADVTIVAGEDFSLSVRADESAIDNILTSVVGTTLLVSEERGASSSHIEIVIHAPTLSSVEILGARSPSPTSRPIASPSPSRAREMSRSPVRPRRSSPFSPVQGRSTLADLMPRM
jgi:hypothetical protein